MGTPRDTSAIVAHFLRRLAQDRDAGDDRPLAEYQAAYPGFEGLIAEQHAVALGSDESTDPGPLDAFDPISAGRVVGRFEIVRRIGRGGQGAVYEAIDPSLRRRVALKILTGIDVASDGLSRFRREAETASRLDHPCICTVYEADLGSWPPYIAMQLVEGETLLAHIAAARSGSNTDPARGAFAPPSDVASLRRQLHYFARAADALSMAHEVGVIHRDVKPGNLMVTSNGDPVILDFGLAAALSGDQPSITRTGELFGTPAYMAPEQIDPNVGPIDGRSDVHALAVCLFEAITLTNPFRGVTRDSLYREILTRDAPDVRRFFPAAPSDLSVVLSTALQKQPDHRYATAALFADDLRAVAELRPIRARSTPGVVRVARWARREPAKARLVGGLLVLSVLLLVAAGYLAARQSEFAAATRQRKQQRRAATVEALLEEGFFLLEESRNDAARARFAEALHASGGTSEEAVCGQVIALLRDERAADALALIDDVGLHRPSVRRSRAAALRSLGRIEESDRVLAELGEPTEAIDLLVAGMFSMSALPGFDLDPKRALSLLTRAVFVADRPRALYHLERSRAAMMVDDVAAQLDSVHALLAHTHDNPIVLTHLAQCYRDTDPGRSIEYAERCLSQRPRHVDAWLVLAGALSNLGRFEEADAACGRALSITDEFAGAHAMRAHCRAMLGDLEGAEAAADAALAIEPDNPSGHYYKGVARLRAGDPDAAVIHLRRTSELRPTSPSLVAYGECLCRIGDTDGGRAAFRDALALDPRDAGAHTGLGVLAIWRREFDQAIEHFQTVLETRPDDPTAIQNLIATWSDVDRPEEILVFLEARIAARPDSASDRLRLARFLVAADTPLDMQDPSAAREHARVARRLWDESPAAGAALRDSIDALLAELDGEN